MGSSGTASGNQRSWSYRLVLYVKARVVVSSNAAHAGGGDSRGRR